MNSQVAVRFAGRDTPTNPLSAAASVLIEVFPPDNIFRLRDLTVNLSNHPVKPVRPAKDDDEGDDWCDRDRRDVDQEQRKQAGEGFNSGCAGLRGADEVGVASFVSIHGLDQQAEPVRELDDNIHPDQTAGRNRPEAYDREYRENRETFYLGGVEHGLNSVYGDLK